MLLGCTFALVAGSRIERTGAISYLMCWIFSTVARATFEYKLLGGLSILAADVVLLGVFSALVWKAHHNWPVWACAFQTVIVTSQVLFLTNFAPALSAYFTIVNAASLGIIVSIICGSVVAWQERQFSTNTVNDLGRYS